MNLTEFTKNNKFLMLALDHRASFKKLMNPENPEGISDQEAINLKAEIISALEDQFSGLLIDVDYGLPAYKDKSKSFLLPVEKTGYEEKQGERITQLEYSVSDLKNMGASGAKLLLYFNPNLISAAMQINTAKRVQNDCMNNNFPLFLEVVTYEPEGKKEHREKLVLDSLEMLLKEEIRPDVYKLEYPGSKEVCKKITEKLNGLPWILLTRGVSFDEFVPQLKDAVNAGAQGFLAGRALWQEVCSLQSKAKEEFLRETLPNRFKLISEIASNPP